MERAFLKSWLIMAVCVLTAVLPVRASTIAYWRFEGATEATRMVDSSGNGHTLTNVSTSSLVLPGAGNGSAFPDSVGKGLANDRARAITVQNQNLQTADSPDFTISSNTGQWTAEAFVNKTVNFDASQTIVGQYDNSATFPERSWSLFRASSDGSLRLRLSTSGTGGGETAYTSGLILGLNTDYYVGVSFDLSKVGVGTNGITFYVKDLTHSGELQVVYRDLVSGTLHDSLGVLMIGARAGNASGTNQGDRWIGLIDEVRLSNTVLDAGQLLFLPEPATAGLLLMGLGGLTTRRHRKGREVTS